MSTEDPRIDLQQLIDRELKNLPAPHAPASLMPRVMAATAGLSPLETRHSPLAPGHSPLETWSRRPWLEWPRALQVVSASAFVAFGAALAMALAFIQAAPRDGSVVASVAARIRSVVETAAQAAAVVRALSDLLLQPAAWALLILGISLSLACAALWSALERSAMGGASQQ